MNLIYTITGNIDSNTAQNVIQWVNGEMIKGGEINKLRVVISSTGGDVDSAIRIYSFLKALPFEVETVGLSQIDSVANVIFLSGSKRIAVDGCRFFLHHIVFSVVASSGYLNYFEEILTSFEEMEKRHEDILQKELNKTKKEVKDILKGARFYSSFEAKELGLVTDIVNKL